MSSTSTTWTTDTNTKSGTVQVYSSNVSVLRLVADEGNSAILDLFADQGDDNADKWRMWVNASDDDLHFSNYTSGTAWTDILTIQDGGNVGIGTASPGGRLQIEAADETAALIINASADNARIDAIKIEENDASRFVFSYEGDSSTNSLTLNSSTTNNIMAWLPSGYVGIGTASPDTQLEIYSTATAGTGTGGSLRLTSNDGTSLVNTERLGVIEFAGAENNSGGIAVGARIEAVASESWSGTDNGASLDFYTTPGDNDPTQRMTILPGGEVGIGTASPAVTLTVGQNQAAHGFIRCNSNTNYEQGVEFAVNDGLKWRIYNSTDDVLKVYDFGDSSVAASIATTENDWQAGSDLRIKKDIVNMDSCLTKINALRPITWKRKYGKTDRVYPGLVAQEVLPHIPLVVNGTEDSFQEITKNDHLTYEGGLTIGYSNFVPYLIKAIQELSAKVEALENA